MKNEAIEQIRTTLLNGGWEIDRRLWSMNEWLLCKDGVTVDVFDIFLKMKASRRCDYKLIMEWLEGQPVWKNRTEEQQ